MINRTNGKIKKNNTYTVVSIRDNDAFFKGTYLTFKEAQKVARNVDSHLTIRERLNGACTEIWTNYNESTGTVQTVHPVSPKKR